MKNVLKVVNLIEKPKVISEALVFPLTSESLQDIQTLKDSFRQSFVDFQVYSLGISAPQIGLNKRLFLMPKNFSYGMISNFKLIKEIVKDFDIFINPTILSSSDEVKDDYEYCLSVDTNEYLVRRPAKVEVQYYEEDGIQKTEVLNGLRARIFQHEYDHLEGRLISEIGTLVPRDVARKPGREVRRGSRRKLENML